MIEAKSGIYYLNIQSTIDFSSCTCDLTEGGCDPGCCCDPDCDDKTVLEWKLKNDYCKNEQF